MTARRTVHVKTHKRSVGRRCLHCGRPATVTGIAIVGKGKWRLPVRYCQLHAVEMGAIKEVSQ